jgi:hypothetical protein
VLNVTLEVLVVKRLWRSLTAKRKDIALVAILFLLPLACFADVVLQPYTFYFVDIQLVQYPGRVFLANALKGGQLPFWNPYIFMGFPLLAEPEIGPLYPFNLLFALPIPHYYVLTLFLVLHFSLAAVFAYLLARSLAVSCAGSFVSGLAFAFGGFLGAQLNNMNILTGSVWLPLILCLFSLALRKRSYLFAAGAGVALAAQILTAHPQILLYTLIVLGTYTLYSLVTLPRADARQIRTVSLLSVTAVAVGLGLAAVQLLPTFQLQQYSALSESPGYDFVTAYSLPKYRLLSFVFPGFLGTPVTGYRGEPFFEEHHGYIGILPLILAAWAWSKRRDPQVRFFGILALLSIVLALGNETPLYHLLAHVPVYNYFRIPARWLLVLSLSLAVLAGYGFDAVVERRERGLPSRWVRGLPIAGVVLTLTLPSLFFYRKEAMAAIRWVIGHVYSGPATRTLQALIHQLPQFPDGVQTNLLAQLLPPLLNPLIFFLLTFNASALLLFFFLRLKISLRWFQFLALGLIIFDLFMAGGTTIVQVQDASFYDEQPSIAFLEQHLGLYRIFSPDAQGKAPQKLLDYFPTIYHIQSMGNLPSVSVLTPRRYNEFLDALRQNTRLLNLAGVKYILTGLDEPPDWWHNHLDRVYSAEGLNIYENLDVLPRAFLVHQAEVPGFDEAILAALTGEEFDISSSILLEDPSALDRLASLNGASRGVEGEDKVTFADYGLNRVVIETTSSQPAFLFLSDTDFPGWKAHVDGREETLYRADYLFRAVLVPSGQHTVEFTFDPVPFKIGLAIALVTAAALVAAAIATLRRIASHRPAKPYETR